MNIIPLNDDERSDVPDSSSKEQKDNNENNNTQSNNVNSNSQKNDNDINNKERNISTTIVIDNKENNNKEEIDCSDFIIEENNNEHKRNISCVQSFDINIELNGEKMLKRKISKNNINGKERYSDTINNSENEYNIRRNTIRVSDCSEKITDISGERKVPYFKTNFETETHNIDVKQNINNNKNISFNDE